MGPICGYCNECKKLTTIMGPIWGYCNECKNQRLLLWINVSPWSGLKYGGWKWTGKLMDKIHSIAFVSIEGSLWPHWMIWHVWNQPQKMKWILMDDYDITILPWW
jgi:hypothetical protein